MNYFKETPANIQETIFDNAFKALKIRKKTKRVWDYIFESSLVPGYFTLDNASNGSKPVMEVYLKQLEFARKYGEEFKISTLEKMFKRNFDKKTFVDNLDNAMKLLPKDILKMLIKANSRYIDYNLGKKILSCLNINDLYEVDAVTEDLVEENISSFDTSLFYKIGFHENLSADFIEKYTQEIELLNMHDEEEINYRKNISVQESYVYENSGCCLEETYSNGASVYIPYGVWCDIFGAIEKSTRYMEKEIDEMSNTLREIDSSMNSIKFHESLIEDIKNNMETLKKQKILLESFSNLKYSI